MTQTKELDTWVVFNKDEHGFWSNDDGWVDLASATRFSLDDVRRHNPPTGGVFITEAIAQTTLWPGCGKIAHTKKSCLSISAIVTVSFVVSLAFDDKQRIPGEQEFRENLLENFACHPAIEDPDTAGSLKYEIIDAHEE
jgi:hypothetical protein